MSLIKSYQTATNNGCRNSINKREHDVDEEVVM